jgi:hypothetical protein
MFDVYCPTCEARVLLTPRRIERVRNTPAGIVVWWRCWCGTRGVLRTGRGAEPNGTFEQSSQDPRDLRDVAS